MRNRVERLRVWLLAGAGLLVVVLTVFIGSARYMKRHFLSRLPARLGVNIKSETNGFTYSQSMQGRTIYTIHASKEIEHSNGVISLHDVSMVLYGRTGDRADRIYGNEFEYDQSAGVVRAVGLVHIDVGAAGSGHGGSATAADLKKGEDDPEGGPKLLHATTSGLVYLEKLGVAATSEAIDFDTGQMKGHAIGADYNTDTGVLLLHSAVDMSGIAGGRAAHVTAGTAQLEDRGQRAVLTHAHYTSPTERMEADEATLWMNPDSSLKRAQERGSVVLQARGGTVEAAAADVTMGEKNKAQLAVLTGGVRYSEEGPLRQARGKAAEARIAFDAAGAPAHATFTGSVEMVERTRPVENLKVPWSVRDLVAETVDAMLAPAPGGRTQLSKVVAKGGAHLTVVDHGSTPGAPGRGTTELSGDEMTAHMLPGADLQRGPLLDTLAARGHTALRQVDAAGVVQTSAADMLDARFRQAGTIAGSGAKGAATQELQELASATEEGHVRMTRQVAATANAKDQEGFEEATAAHAVYDGDSDVVHLSGGVHLSESGSVLWADQVAFARATGDAQAAGGVKVSYMQEGQADGAEPIHVLADRAEMKHATDVASFFGKPARMWQAGSQVQAPVLELARKQRQLTAHGDRAGAAGPAVVQTILMEGPRAAASSGTRAPEGARASKQSSGLASGAQQRMIRVWSHDLAYSDDEREAVFGGGVKIQSALDTIVAREATAYLQSGPAAPQATGKGPREPLSMDGRVDRVIARGAVVVEQPGRRATGERLVYTAADATVVLSGDRSTPPQVVDRQRGTTVTATAFRFRTDDESVEALSAVPDAEFSGQVHTVTPVKR